MSQTYSNHHYNKVLQPFARQNRNSPTKAENHLWYNVLHDRRMLGYKFLRQRPVGNYIADFMCKDLWLIVELDGSSHDGEEAEERDGIRQKALEELGFTVLRFFNGQVLNNLPWVESTLEEWIRGKEGKK